MLLCKRKFLFSAREHPVQEVAGSGAEVGLRCRVDRLRPGKPQVGVHASAGEYG